MHERMRALRSHIAGAAACVLLLGAVHAPAQEESGPAWDRWSVHDPREPTEVNHEPMTRILEAINVTDRRRHLGINYAALRGRGVDYLQAYIDYLEQIPVSRLNRDEQLAYWLNLHNAQVIELIARDGSSRIDQRRGKPGMPGDWWSAKRLTVEGHTLSLEDIEQNILIRHWQDPLVLYGLCYGVNGSPVIGATALTGATVHERLAEAARNFVNDTGNVSIKGRKDVLAVSSLYVWHRTTLFEDDDARIIAHLQNYARGRLAEALKSADAIDRHRFDWDSNSYTPRVIALPTRPSQGAGVGS